MAEKSHNDYVEEFLQRIGLLGVMVKIPDCRLIYEKGKFTGLGVSKRPKDGIYPSTRDLPINKFKIIRYTKSGYDQFEIEFFSYKVEKPNYPIETARIKANIDSILEILEKTVSFISLCREKGITSRDFDFSEIEIKKIIVEINEILEKIPSSEPLLPLPKEYPLATIPKQKEFPKPWPVDFRLPKKEKPPKLLGPGPGKYKLRVYLTEEHKNRISKEEVTVIPASERNDTKKITKECSNDGFAEFELLDGTYEIIVPETCKNKKDLKFLMWYGTGNKIRVWHGPYGSIGFDEDSNYKYSNILHLGVNEDKSIEAIYKYKEPTWAKPGEREEFGFLTIRSFWYYRGEKKEITPEREIPTDVYIKESRLVNEYFERKGWALVKGKGYKIKDDDNEKTPLYDIPLPPGKYTLLCEYSGTGQFEQRVQRSIEEIEITKTGKQHVEFFFEIIGAGGHPPPAPPEQPPRDEELEGDEEGVGGSASLTILSQPFDRVPIKVKNRKTGNEETVSTTAIIEGEDGDIIEVEIVNKDISHPKTGVGHTFSKWDNNSTDTKTLVRLKANMIEPQAITAIYEALALIIDSKPVKRVGVTIEGENERKETLPTPIERTAKENTQYNVTVPERLTDNNGVIWTFRQWDDGEKKTKRSIFIKDKSVSITAIYESLEIIVDSKPIRNVRLSVKNEKTDTQLEADEKEPRTPKEYNVEANTPYLVEVESSHDDGKSIWSFDQWEDGDKNRKKKVFVRDKSIELMAVYTKYSLDKDTKYKERARIRSPYQQGLAPGVRKAGDTAAAVLGRGMFRKEGITKEMGFAQTGKKSPYKSPLVRAAINKGKRMLNKYARAEYSVTIEPFIKDADKKKKELKANTKFIRKELRKIRRAYIKSKTEAKGLKGAISGVMGAAGAGVNEYDILRLGKEIGYAGIEQFDKAITERDEFYRKFRNDFESAAARLEKMMTEKAELIAIQVARRYKLPLNSEEEQVVTTELLSYAKYLTEQFISRGRTAGHAIFRGLSNLSRSMQTSADVWNNFLTNLWNIITGPWTIGAIFVLLQFFFITAWIGYHPLLLFWIPIVGAMLTFILNFESSKQPLDWIGHLFAGAMISMSFIILFYSLGITMETMGGGVGFFIFGGLIFVLIGLFQFYQLGGFRQAVMIAIIALLFGYVALGPYSGYWQVVKDQVKTPLNMAWRAIKGAVTDVWLLATNPTEWYARQQLVNVKPEKPIDFPKGIEVTLFDVMPPTVPGDQEFAVTAVFKNEGEMTAKDIKITAECNQWCDTRFMTSDSNFGENGKPDASGFFQYYVKDPVDQSKRVLGKLERKEADTLTLSHLVARTVGGREAEFRMAKVKLKISYGYYTSSSLLVDIMSQDELTRLFREGKDVYKNVLAVDKVTPARLSLNVGPQPLKAGTENALLLLSISNVRDDGEIKLKLGNMIKITLPPSIGSKLNCGGSEAGPDGVLNYQIPSELTIKAYDFSSIFAILCSFDVAENVDTVRTGLITAELGTKDNPGYEFVVFKEKDVPITTPLGIFYDPFNAVCAQCGVGKGICDIAECHAITIDSKTKTTGKCWFDSTKKDPISKLFKESCRSCGIQSTLSDKCVQFLTQSDCISESIACGFSCKWHPVTKQECKKNIPVSAGGANVCTYNGWCESAAVTLGSCSNIPSSYIEKYNSYKDIIETNVRSADLNSYGINGNALIAAIISQESSWNEKATGDNGNSYGLMQINLPAHTECNAASLKAFDVNDNIYCGAKFLQTLINSHYNKPAETYTCKDTQYSGLQAVLRYYNGWNTDCTKGDVNYVDSVYSNYLNWKACFDKATGVVSTTPTPAEPALGDANYCKWRKDSILDLCKEGEGQCSDSNQCNKNTPIVEGEKSYNLECRDPGIGKNICCYEKLEAHTIEESNIICKNAINR